MNADDATFTPSPTGGVKGRKTATFSEIPTDALWELAVQYGKGLEKYPNDESGLSNWRRGYSWSLSYDAALRHLMQSMSGEDVDAETGSKHLVAAAWHLFALIHWLNDPEMHKYDDRQSTLEKKASTND